MSYTRNTTEQTKKRVLEALSKNMGIVTMACKEAGISRSTFYKYCKGAKFKEEVEDISGVALDFAESKLFSLIKQENPAAIIFYLKTKGRGRGYIEKQELEASVKQVNITMKPETITAVNKMTGGTNG